MKEYIIQLPFEYEGQKVYYKKMNTKKHNNEPIMLITDSKDEAHLFFTKNEAIDFIFEYKKFYSDLGEAKIIEVGV